MPKKAHHYSGLFLACNLLTVLVLKININIFNSHSDFGLRHAVSNWLSLRTIDSGLRFYVSINENKLKDIPEDLLLWLETRAKNSNLTLVLGKEEKLVENLTKEFDTNIPDFVISSSSIYSPGTIGYDRLFINHWKNNLNKYSLNCTFSSRLLFLHKNHFLTYPYKKWGKSIWADKQEDLVSNFNSLRPKDTIDESCLYLLNKTDF